jgi:zona occludens toxin
MITLITGVPGSGKTLYAVWLLKKLHGQGGRRVLVDGIRDLALEHVEIDEPWLRSWHENAQAHDLIVIDEAQRIYPPTTASQRPTPDVEKLHVHRHMGVDFIIITQHPQRISKTVRDLVGRHVHVRNLFGLKRAMLYEWDHCHNPSSLKDAVKTMWPYPRDVFSLYTSAEVHTKKQAVVPKSMFLIPIGVLIFAVLAVKIYHKSREGFGVSPDAATSAPVNASASSASTSSRDTAPARSVEWRVAGRYARAEVGFVVLAADDGRLRVVPAADFRGEGVQLTGEVDGKTVSGWTGAFTRKIEQGGGAR